MLVTMYYNTGAAESVKLKNLLKMTESQLKLGNDLTKDKSVVYEQMKDMKNQISGCARKAYETADCKEDFDSFKQDLLNQCDKWVEAQRAKIDQKFAVI